MAGTMSPAPFGPGTENVPLAYFFLGDFLAAEPGTAPNACCADTDFLYDAVSASSAVRSTVKA